MCTSSSVFPPRFAWLLESRWRSSVLSPSTLRTRLGLRGEEVVCEIGVGGGYYARELAAGTARYIAIDIQIAMLERLAPLAGVDAVQADATALPLASESVDIAIAVTVLGEIPAPLPALKEMARIIKPGGIVSISEHLPDPDFVPFSKLQTMCASAGLTLEARHGSRWSYTSNWRRERN